MQKTNPRSSLRAPIVMGIVNATPDSFSDGGRFEGQAGVEHALRLAEEGAQVLDIGGESTRPGAETIGVQEEIDRILPIIEAVAARVPAPISVDTRKPEVARAAVAAGAAYWNDVSALRFSEDSLSVAAELRVPVVLMHAQGDPATMQDAPAYQDVTAEVLAFLHERIAAARAAGVAEIIADPGIGFGKAPWHNVTPFRSLDRVSGLGVPLMMGASRKRFISTLDRDGPPESRLGGSLAAVLRARQANFAWFRVHDVAQTRQALALWEALGPSNA